MNIDHAYRILPTVLLIFIVTYGLGTVSHMLFLADAYQLEVASMSLVSALFAVALYLNINTRLVRNCALEILVALVILGAFNALLQLHMSGNIEQTTNMIFVFSACGFLIHKTRIFVPLTLLVFASSLAVMIQVQAPEITHYVFALLMSIGFGVLLHALRLLTINQIEDAANSARALNTSENRARLILDSVVDGVIATDAANNITVFNPVAEDIIGLKSEEVLGTPLDEVFKINSERPSDYPSVQQSGYLVKPDGQEVLVEFSSSELIDAEPGNVITFRDLTERVQVEEQMLVLDKVRSIGVLAGGIAHDFNNLLTSIFGNIAMAERHLEPGNKAGKYLESASLSFQPATELTDQLLTFARGGEPVVQVLDISELVSAAATFALSGTSCMLSVRPAPGLWSVKGDYGQLTQAFINLFINAAQAMHNQGTVFVRLRNKSGSFNQVEIQIEDHGKGISPGDQTRIFDPYFTTKSSGTGLGLSVTHSIISRHQGHIQVESDSRSGTTFSIDLPAVDQAPVSIGERISSETASISSHHFLVMDDEPRVRSTIVDFLSVMGHTSDQASEGETAMKMYEQKLIAGTPYDCVIMDLNVVGGMGGRVATEKILQLNPDAKVIVASGYSNDAEMSRYKEFGFIGVLPKPFQLTKMSHVLSEVLG